MADLRTIDRDHTAVLIMDYQQDIVQSIAARQPQLLEGYLRNTCDNSQQQRLSFLSS